MKRVLSITVFLSLAVLGVARVKEKSNERDGLIKDRER